MSVWQLGEIICRYVFAFIVVTFGTLVLQGIIAALLNGLLRKMKGEPLAIPFWLFITLILSFSMFILAMFVWRLSRHLIGRSLLLSWTLLIGIMFAYATNGFYKAWNRGW